MSDGTAVDIILNPLGVPSRMNVGQVLEAHLGYAARWGWKDVEEQDQVGDSRSAARRTRPGRTPSRARSSPPRCSTVPTGTRRRPPASTRPSRASSRTSTRRAPTAIGSIQPTARPRVQRPHRRAVRQPDHVGYMYISSWPTSSTTRSTPVPPARKMITRSPSAGRPSSRQRFGEMEVWALEAYGRRTACRSCSPSSSTTCSAGSRVYEAIVKGENIPEPCIPESFKVLMKEMQALCLNVEVLANDGARSRCGRWTKSLPCRRGTRHRHQPQRARHRQRHRSARRRKPAHLQIRRHRHEHRRRERVRRTHMLDVNMFDQLKIGLATAGQIRRGRTAK